MPSRTVAAARSYPIPLLHLRGFARAVVPAAPSVPQTLRSPAASPSAHSRRWDAVDAEVLLGESLRLPGSLAVSAARLARSAVPPALASLPTPRPSATAPAPTTLALARSPTCDWTCELLSGISFSRRLSPLKRDSQPELYPSSGESRCFLFLRFQLNVGHPPLCAWMRTLTTKKLHV